MTIADKISINILPYLTDIAECHESKMNPYNSPETKRTRVLENLKKCNYSHSSCQISAENKIDKSSIYSRDREITHLSWKK